MMSADDERPDVSYEEIVEAVARAGVARAGGEIRWEDPDAPKCDVPIMWGSSSGPVQHPCGQSLDVDVDDVFCRWHRWHDCLGAYCSADGTLDLIDCRSASDI